MTNLSLGYEIKCYGIKIEVVGVSLRNSLAFAFPIIVFKIRFGVAIFYPIGI